MPVNNEDKVTLWPTGLPRSQRLTRAQARLTQPPYLPPLGERFDRNTITAHRDLNGEYCTAQVAAQLGHIPTALVKDYVKGHMTSHSEKIKQTARSQVTAAQKQYIQSKKKTA